ncbi:MAG: peptidoglycan DD-metalloendopeptidase family protein [Chitinivibrionales bacterium]|nr:peptidoglycan DD-metalloendopeptidase family protein [Chitinivibrionales bacterium]
MTTRKKKKNSYYTIMFVPEDNSRTFSVKLHKNFLRLLTVVIIIFATGIGVLILNSGKIGARLQLVSLLRDQKRQLQEENQKLLIAQEKLERIEKVIAYLEEAILLSGEKKPAIEAELKEIADESTKLIPQKTGADTRSDYWTSIPTIRPIEGWLTRKYSPGNGLDRARSHSGVDFAASEGTPIRVTAPGIVSEVKHDPYYGILVVVNHKYNFQTYYGHCLQALVAAGQSVKRGQTIALCGNTGNSTAPHLHYEVRLKGEAQNPVKYIFTSVYE